MSDGFRTAAVAGLGKKRKKASKLTFLPDVAWKITAKTVQILYQYLYQILKEMQMKHHVS